MNSTVSLGVTLPTPSDPSVVTGLSSAARYMCSARGCHERAHWGLYWNNPRLHSPERRKRWLACDEHRVSLSEFLGMRGFLRECQAVESAV